jgi:hypothetical protein
MKAPHRIRRISVRDVSHGVPSDNVAAGFSRIGPEQEVASEVRPVPAAFDRSAPGQHALDNAGIEENDDRRKGASKIARRHLQHYTNEYGTGRTIKGLRALSLRDIFLIHIFFALLAQL